MIYDYGHMSLAPNGFASSRKEVTHKRIVEAAARAIRRNGYCGAGVADIMQAAGLTHGGFYAHFASREVMLAEAIDRAGVESVAKIAAVAAAVPSKQALEAIMQAYLSQEHFDNPEIGCPIAALGSETPRQAPGVRRAATHRIKEMVDLVARQSSNWGTSNAHEEALVLVAAMAGAMSLARAVDDPDLSQSFLGAVLKHFAST